MKKRKTKSILKFYGLLVIAFLIIFPVVWFFLLSIKSQRVAFASPLLLYLWVGNLSLALLI